MKPRYIGALASVACLLLACDPKPGASDGPTSIGPQFWLYDVTDYERAEQDVMSGLGGRWISVRYEAKEEAAVDRTSKVQEIIEAFLSDGWKREALPTQPYVLSEIYETATDDLYFRRGARGDEPSHWQFTNAIHVSIDGRTICTYCEVIW